MTADVRWIHGAKDDPPLQVHGHAEHTYVLRQSKRVTFEAPFLYLLFGAIDKGEITFPVSEMTVAGNLKDIFARLQAADDLEFKAGVDSPTLRVDDLTVAGA